MQSPTLNQNLLTMTLMEKMAMVSHPWNQPIETFFFQEEVSWRFAYLCLKRPYCH